MTAAAPPGPGPAVPGPAATRLAAAAALAWAATIAWASHRANPVPSFPDWLLAHDKVIHAGVFGLLGLLLRLAVAARARSARRAWLVAWGLAVAWGFLDEVHQSFIPGRDSDVRDALADALGAALGAGLAGAWLRRVKSEASIGR
ncbi:MAG: VanZ family protein [Anaeromyxobacteraceae bacterium]